jgi:hypothetical protein
MIQSPNKKKAAPKAAAAKRVARPSQNNRSAVAAPVAQGFVRKYSAPRSSSLNNGDFRVSHREYITDILGSVVFTANTFSINPGLVGTFPWLSAISSRFESYRFERLEFAFETEAPTSATGSVLLTVDYDASDAAPQSKSQAMSYRSCVRSPPWAPSRFTADPEDLSKRKSSFSRSGAVPANTDAKLYDVGTLFVCTQGQAGATAVGELYVEYTVLLMTPQLGVAGASFSVGGRISGSSNAAPFATVTGNMPMTIVSSGTTTSVTTFTFTQPWEGVMGFYAQGTGLTGTVASGTAAVKFEEGDVSDGGGLNTVALYRVQADIGATFILTISNTTIGVLNSDWGQYDL